MVALLILAVGLYGLMWMLGFARAPLVARFTAQRQSELEKPDNKQILPGRPLEAYLKAGELTPLSYLTKPMTDYFRRAVREG